MLEKDRFLTIKQMAQAIRRENEELFNAFKMESAEDAIREKEEFIETILDRLDDEFTTGDLGKEERQIFRANVLIPDDEEFLETYSKDKNIRNLMSTYAVGIEDIMSKITELNIYADYLKDEPKKVTSKKAPKKNITPRFVTETPKETYTTRFVTEETKSEEPFVDAMVDLSSEDAGSLLDEIENLSNTMDELDISKNTETTSDYDFNIEDLGLDDIKTINDIEEDKDLNYSSDMSIDDISAAVDGFVDDYNTIQTDLENSKKALNTSKKENEKLKEQVKKFKEDAYAIKKNNLENAKLLKVEKAKTKTLEKENKELHAQVEELEDKVKRSVALLRKIYDSIPKHNIKI